ncbi:hypothetical protein QR98_0023730 [Sarcoptes scabiei]|nr:hypothetical protein QR98_0023730 [Sarcoptes scabiei]
MPTENRQIDCYRGLTVLTRIYNKYYPIPDEERLVNYEQFQESLKQLPLWRSSRFVGQESMRMKLITKKNQLNFI